MTWLELASVSLTVIVRVDGNAVTVMKCVIPELVVTTVTIPPPAAMEAEEAAEDAADDAAEATLVPDTVVVTTMPSVKLVSIK